MFRWVSKSKRLICDVRGAAAVEFALTVPVLLLVLGFMIEGGRIYWTKNTLQYAVDEVGRTAMMNTSLSSSQLSAAIADYIYGMSADNIAVSVQSATSEGVTFVTLTATIPFQGMYSMLSGEPSSITASSRVPSIN